MKKILTSGLIYLAFFALAFFAALAFVPKSTCKHSVAPPALQSMEVQTFQPTEECRECYQLLCEVEQMMVKLIHTDEGPQSKELKARILACFRMINKHIKSCPTCQAMYGAVPDVDPSYSVLDTSEPESCPRGGM